MNKKEKLIDTARELFTNFGYKRVSMDEIAQKSGITKKTVYSYFKNKDELFYYFVSEELLNMKNIVEKIKIEDTNSFHKILYQLIKYKKESKFLNLITTEVDTFRNESLIEISNKIDDSIKSYIKEKIEVLIEKEIIKEIDVDLCTFLIYTIYISIMFNYSSEKLDEKEISDTVISILKTGLFN